MRINDIQVSKNFKLYEFECKDGQHQVKLDPRVLQRLQALRDLIGKPLKVNSGYRTSAYNKIIGGSPNSQHMLGKAVDIALPVGINVDAFAALGKRCGFTGIGMYKWGCHFDVRDVPKLFDMR